MVDRSASLRSRFAAAGVGIVALGLTFVNAAAAQLSCREWNTSAFFRTATLSDVSRCLEAGANIEARDEIGWTLLHRAAWERESPVVMAVVKALLDAGGNIEARSKIGETPLHKAAGYPLVKGAASWGESPDVLKVLLDTGANIEARNEDGETPLHMAAKWESPAGVRELINAGANIEARDKYGRTPTRGGNVRISCRGEDPAQYWCKH